jgi:hypothetical protein
MLFKLYDFLPSEQTVGAKQQSNIATSNNFFYVLSLLAQDGIDDT